MLASIVDMQERDIANFDLPQNLVKSRQVLQDCSYPSNRINRIASI